MTIKKPILDVLNKRIPQRKPIWMMRQAGRYLPEYQEIRKKTGSFLNLCYTPKYASEVTLQPIKRFDLDAAIIFADILLLPNALGQNIDFKPKKGPVLEPIRNETDIKKLQTNSYIKNLMPVFETIHLTLTHIPKNIALIGFCGAPWTVASYMIEGQTSKMRPLARRLLEERIHFNENKSLWWIDTLFDILVETSAQYLSEQVKAGAEVLQIFDSWAQDWAENKHAFEKYCLNPITSIVSKVRKDHPHIPIILYTRNLPLEQSLQIIQQQSQKQSIALSVGHHIYPKDIAHKIRHKNIVIQGNLDPNLLLQGKEKMYCAINDILNNFKPQNHIFNLGHGILPQTPVKHVNQMIEYIRSNQFQGQ